MLLKKYTSKYFQCIIILGWVWSKSLLVFISGSRVISTLEAMKSCEKIPSKISIQDEIGVLRWYFYIQDVSKNVGFWNRRKIQITIIDIVILKILLIPIHGWPWDVKRTGQFPNIWHPTLLWDDHDHDGDFDSHYADNNDAPKLFFSSPPFA